MVNFLPADILYIFQGLVLVVRTDVLGEGLIAPASEAPRLLLYAPGKEGPDDEVYLQRELRLRAEVLPLT